MQVRLTDLHSKPSFCSYSIDTDFFFFHFFFPFKPFSGVFSLSLSLCIRRFGRDDHLHRGLVLQHANKEEGFEKHERGACESA